MFCGEKDKIAGKGKCVEFLLGMRTGIVILRAKKGLTGKAESVVNVLRVPRYGA